MTALPAPQHAPTMTPCRPDSPGPRCPMCSRKDLPTSHVTAGGRLVEHVVMDPTTLPHRTRPCAFFVASSGIKEAA
jgi:hypothetical protein